MWQEFWEEEEGMGTVEMILIIAALVTVALVFRKSIVDFMEQTGQQVFNTANSNGKAEVPE